MNKKIIFRSIFTGSALFLFICTPTAWVHAAEETDAYCVVPEEAVPHGSTVALTIKFVDNDKSNDVIVQGPFKILKYPNGKPRIVDFKRGNDKDDAGRENPEKPTLTFNVTVSPKHKLPAPATESVTLAYFVKHKEGKRGELFTTDHEQQVDCAFMVQHEIEKTMMPSGGEEEDTTRKNIAPADLGVQNSGILPISRFYFLKEWRRGIERFFAFDLVKKAGLELRITNEKAAEALTIQETKPNDVDALATALENYTRAAARLEVQLVTLKETSENPNLEKLLKKLDEQTLKHAILFNQLTERWTTDPYVEDANVVHPRGARDNHLQGAVDIAQKKIQEVVVAAAQKDKNIEQKAVGQIMRAESAIKEVEFALAEFAINEPGVPNVKTAQILQANCKDIPQPPAECGEGRILSCVSNSARKPTWQCSLERQTSKKDFGDRMKVGLDTASGTLANAKAFFTEGKFGEAFGKARVAEVLARNGLRLISNNAKKLIREGVDADAPRIEDVNSAMPIVPGTGTAWEKIVPEVETRVFPETNNRVFPETNNRTACDDRQAPGCLRGEILECHEGTWVCIGPATGGEQILNPTASPSASEAVPTLQETCRQKGSTCNIIPGTNDCYCYDARNCETPDCKME